VSAAATAAVYIRAERTLWRQARESVFVLAVPGREIIALDGSGSVLWQLLTKPLTVHEIAARLAELYDVSGEVVTRDIALVLDELAERGIVNRVHSP
jgi:hypothetical protein